MVHISMLLLKNRDHVLVTKILATALCIEKFKSVNGKKKS